MEGAKKLPLTTLGLIGFGKRQYNLAWNAIERKSRNGGNMPLAMIVDWVGPFTDYNEFKQVAANYDGLDVVYLALGSHNICNYVGITKASATRFQAHEKMADESNRRYWIGEITSQRLAGRKSGRHSTDLGEVEKFLIHILQPKLNRHFKNWEPDDCFSVFSRFFSRRSYYEDDWETVEGPKKFPKLIGWNSWSEEYTSCN